MASRHRPLPPMVLLYRYVPLVDELGGIIQEIGGPSADEAMELALSNSSISTKEDRQKALRAELRRYRVEVEEPAFAILRKRKASRRPSAAVRKEVTFTSVNADYYREVLDGIEPCLSHVADALSVTFLSLNISWPPGHPERRHLADAFIESCHQSLLVLCVGNCRPGNSEPGFYLVYNTRDNSVAIVPQLFTYGVSSSGSHRDIAGGAAVLCLRTTPTRNKKRDDYLLVELLLRMDDRSHLTTNEATLFMWESPGSGGPMTCQWLRREVVLPLPLTADEDEDVRFFADMVFAVGSTSLCWVDLLSGILVYKHTAAAAGNTNKPLESAFHFIPLPEEYASRSELRDQMHPEEYRSMCCVNAETLKFVSMDGYNQEELPRAKVKFMIWVLYQPLSPTKCLWQLVRSVNVGDFWHNHLYNDLSLNPTFPVISTLKPDVIYVSVRKYKYNHKDERMDATELYVLSLDMRLQSVVSSFKVPCENDGIVPHQRIFTSDFTIYLDQTRGDLYEEYQTWKEVADEEESRSNPAVWTSLWISRGEEGLPQSQNCFI